jgi:guanylate kinase
MLKLRATLIRIGLWASLSVCAAGPPRGGVFVLSAPSGTGKSTLIKRLVKEVPGLAFAVSHTTREPRPGEREGVDYFFVDDARFDAMLARSGFQEWVETYGHRYGLSKAWMEQRLAAGQDLLLDLDTTGARMLRQAVPAVTVFLLPPSAAELSRRLRGRGSESRQQLELRLGQARRELSRYTEYDYLVLNQNQDEAFLDLQAIILAARARRERRDATAREILAGFWTTSAAPGTAPGRWLPAPRTGGCRSAAGRTPPPGCCGVPCISGDNH